MSKELIFNKDARNRLLQGVNKISNAVKSTLGPGGRNVMINVGGLNGIHILKDGVGVARNIHVKDPVENMAIQLLKKVSDGTDNKVGDGTTTAMVLAQAMFSNGVVLMNEHKVKNMHTFTLGMEDARKYIISELSKMNNIIDLETSSGIEMVKHIATVSSNGDLEIVELMLDSLLKVGRDGVYRIEGGKYRESYVEKKEGLSYDMGMLSPFMANNKDRTATIFDDCDILLTNYKLESLEQIKNILDVKYVKGERTNPLFVIANDFSKEVILSAVQNISMNNLPICFVKTPGFGNETIKYLEDIGIVVGAIPVLKEKNMDLRKADLSVLGSAKKVNITFDKFMIVDGGGKEEDIEERLKVIRKEYEDESDGYLKDRYNERFAKMSSGVAIIHLGSYSDVELYEKKYRMEDTLHSVRNAIKDGFLPGGGISLYSIHKDYFSKKHEFLDKSYEYGYELVMNSIAEPISLLHKNIGIPFERDKYTSSHGLDLKSMKYGNMIEMGIIDPYAVTISALSNAISVTKTLLTTEVVIYDEVVEDMNQELGYHQD